MAAGSKLKLTFGTASGQKTFSYNYGNASASASTINTAMDTMIENGEIFQYPPLTKVKAVVEVTTSTEFELT